MQHIILGLCRQCPYTNSLKHVKSIILVLVVMMLMSIPTLAQDEEGEVITDVAMVSSIDVDEGEEISITISGDLPDSCTEIGEISQSIEDDIITITVETTRPADAMCATVLTAFEETYILDTDEIEAGEYTLDVNGVTETVTIVASADAESVELTCPEADEDSSLFDDLGMCFLYPSENDVMSGRDFALISQPMTSNALLLIQVEDADDITLDDIREQFDETELVVEDIVIGDQDALILETDNQRQAYVIVNEQVYSFTVQPIEDESGELLWAEVINSIFFPEPEDT